MNRPKYLNVSIDFTLYGYSVYDVRIPLTLTVKELLEIVINYYKLNITLYNPILRIKKSNKIISNFENFNMVEQLYNGELFVLESV